MNESANKPRRILVVARPSLGRSVADALTAAGHQVHRSPRPVDVEALVRSIAPDAALISLDLPWADPLELAAELRARPHPVPVLLLGDDDADSLPHIAPNAEPECLRARVSELIAAPPGSTHEDEDLAIMQIGATANARSPRIA